MEVRQQGNYVKEAGRLGWLLLSELCEGGVLCLRGDFLRGRYLGEP